MRISRTVILLGSQFGLLGAVKTAAVFAGLLTRAELQANCLRLESLVHLASLCCEGTGSPTTGFWFGAPSTSLARVTAIQTQPDPSEYVSVALVNTPRGNFRVFEGIREGNAFHLQRILNVIETMPAGAAYDRLWFLRGVLARRISEAIAGRAAIVENSLGQEFPLGALPPDLAQDLPVLRRIVKFSERDLENLGASRQSLNEFVFDPGRATFLRRRPLGTQIWKRRPLAIVGEFLYVLLPMAIGSAITRAVVEFVTSMNKDRAFERALAADFADLLRDTPLLGHGVELGFQRIDGGLIGGVLKQVDSGRFLHLVFSETVWMDFLKVAFAVQMLRRRR